jgi:putative cardiolipin synthase
LNHCSISIALFVMAGCVSAPLDYPKETSFAVESTSHTREAKDVSKWLNGRTDVSGFYPLITGFDAFGARLALMDNADVSIDAQYFLMKPDYAGLVFSAKLLDAADRGVRVRLLLDDIFTTVEDVDLAMLDNHPNVEVRIFNPIARKGIDTFNYLGHFSLTNRRMHNKSFIVDNQTAIVGGRNIAVEYFQLDLTGDFLDFDIISGGAIVKEVSAEFDTYWNHELAVPMEALFKEKDQAKIEKSRAVLIEMMAEAGESIYAESINTELMRRLYAHELDPFIADARLIADDPQKLLEDISDEYQDVAREMRAVVAEAESEILIFTPYFIPGKRGVKFIRELRAKGIRIVVLTNSLATNNHTSVHSSYSSYRKDLLRAGVELWEARADAAKVITPDGETQLEHLTLHTKGVIVDRKRVFVGSLNLDPRSIDINTEMGLLIDSPELGELLARRSVQGIPGMAYRLKLDENDKITWHATIDGQEVVETTEPQTSGWRRFSAWFLKIAPEKQL